MATMPRTAAAETHEVINQSEPFVDVNVFDSDVALQEAVEREGGGWGVDRMRDFGQVAGRPRPTSTAGARSATSRSSTSTTASATASTRSSTTRRCTGCCGSASSARSTRSRGATRSRARTWCATDSST